MKRFPQTEDKVNFTTPQASSWGKQKGLFSTNSCGMNDASLRSSRDGEAPAQGAECRLHIWGQASRPQL